MSRNNEKNIKKHNDKLHKAQDKLKQAEMLRKEKLKQITKKFNEDKASEKQCNYIMEKNKFSEVKSGVQQIIDFIAKKNAREANTKLAEVSEQLDELLDFAEEDEDLMEISRYQVLLNQLHQKIVGLNGQATESI
ncbi:hypothetical protein [Flavobacterium sp. LS1R10]|nr:hypothetical protein [Flavobacterium sp. LS1R10]